MEHFKGLILLLILLLISCAPKMYKYPEFENSNQRFIEKTIKKLNIGESFKYKLPSTGKIALVSLENDSTMDVPLISMIEDQLIKSLLKQDFTVLERDQNLVKLLVREGINDNYSLFFGKQILIDENGKKHLIVSKPYETQLSSADYLISYRILECGLMYKDIPDNDSTIREALVRLTVRIENTESGEIGFCEPLQSSQIDTIKDEFVDPLASFHYTTYSHEYPLQIKKTFYKHPKKLSPSSNKTQRKSNAVPYLGARIGGGWAEEANISDNSSALVFGIKLGMKNNNFGIFGIDAAFFKIEEASPLTLIGFYEKPLYISSNFHLSPHFGAGISLGEEEAFIFRLGSNLGFPVCDAEIIANLGGRFSLGINFLLHTP